MAKIDYYTMMVDINPYEHEGNKYDALNILITFRKGRGFYVSWQPVLRTSMGYQTGPMPSTDILVGGQGYIVKEASRNNAKTLKAMADAMLQAKDGMKFLFEQHNYEALKNFICNVSCYGYTPAMQQQLQATIKNENEKKEDDMTPMMKQFYDLKKKHPEALLLFRCGDFYETYMEDATQASKILGITVTTSTTMKDAQGKPLVMAGFPHHALDTYLPKIIRAGKRVAICDQLEMPKQKLVHRGSDELTTTENKNTNDQKEEEMEVAINQNETKNVANAQVINNNVCNAPAVEEVEEVVDVTPVKPVTLKRKQSEPVSEVAPQPATTKLPTVTFSTYKTKRGDTAPQIIGFTGEEDPRWKAHKDAGHKWVSASYRRDMSGEKVYCLLFGTRYMDVAKALADAYNTNDVNAWHRSEDACKAVYEQAVRDGKAKWEAKKAEWAEKRAAKEKPQEKGTYRPEDVAKMLQSIMAGGDVPEDIKKLLKAA